MVRLTNKKIRGIIRRKTEGEKTNEQIAAAMKITPRRVQQLYQKYKATGTIPKLNKNRRPKTHLTG
ncbi:MAG: helix-turn-helix domain-containing protein, partial [Candidatus Hydrothermarchaeaceae archaeon]